ncbi:hypothetical protein [Gayadomonas joobiniege]|uniref:hypothetical protein n=1 Tax=Gayadomonas joobiniege TaxID=1234606 RepID=UPI0003783412|nr:hypothetical protein [Gayadomonas joobiniege]
MKVPGISHVKARMDKRIRESAIQAAQSRIILAGRKATDLTEDELEILVKEEEDRIRGQIKEKGLFAVAAALGLGWWL